LGSAKADGGGDEGVTASASIGVGEANVDEDPSTAIVPDDSAFGDDTSGLPGTPDLLLVDDGVGAAVGFATATTLGGL